MDNIDESAFRVGAMNTIINKNGILWGYNTDLIGFKRSLQEEGKMDIKGKNAVVLGAGGAARAIIYVLCEENIKEIILSSKGDSFPLKIKFMDKDDHITDYILFKTRNERLILQKPFFNRTMRYQG